MNENNKKTLNTMQLRVLLPSHELLELEAIKVILEAEDGSFCLLPRHTDFVAALVPGVLEAWDEQAQVIFVAVDEGILVKCGRDVMVSTLDGVYGADFEHLQELVEERFVNLDEHARKARSALARLEAGALRGFRDLQGHAHD